MIESANFAVPKNKFVVSETNGRALMLLVFLLLLICVFWWQTGGLSISPNNLTNVLANSAVIGVISLGQLLVIVSGGFDLSVSGTVPLGGVIFAMLLNSGWTMPLALLVAMASTGIFGLINGVLVGYTKVSPLIATLGTWYLSGGLALTLSGGIQIPFANADDGILTSRSFFGLNNQIWVFLGLCLVTSLVLRYTIFGRSLYAVGGNREAARLAGIPVNMVTLTVYLTSAALAGLAGAILASQLLTGSGTAGINSALQSIAAVILGGAALTGGVGVVSGTLVGVLLLGVLSNGMAMLSIPSFYQTMATGVVLLIAVLLSQLRRTKKVLKKA
jgi:ribose transport system permease protein